MVENTSINMDHNHNLIGKELNILIVDDIKVNFLLIKAILGKLNMNMFWAEDGYKAIEHIENGSTPDIVLMDYNMPGMDGLETTLLIKKILPAVPVISISTFTDSPLFDRSTAPFDAYATKPVVPAELLRLINENVR
ncbi:MAG: response regulator [Ignavibacteria bacterium]|nr:response regulator [Ignavibacteria bacterium]